MRNVLNRRNVIAVRRDTGTETLPPTTIQQLATAAYAADPAPIPYESPRYRAWADQDANGVLEGPGELMPLFLAAARDFAQPIFFYGPPRLFRLGVEFEF